MGEPTDRDSGRPHARLTVQQAAARTGLTEAYVRILCQRGQLTASKEILANDPSRYRWRIVEDDVLRSRGDRSERGFGGEPQTDRRDPETSTPRVTKFDGEPGDATVAMIRDEVAAARTAALQEKAVAEAALEAAATQKLALDEMQRSNSLLLEATAAAQRAAKLQSDASDKLADAVRLRGNALTSLLAPGSVSPM